MTKAEKAASAKLAQSERKELETRAIATVALIPEWVSELVRPLYTFLAIGPQATQAKKSYNSSILGLIVRGLRAWHDVPDAFRIIYDEVATAVAPQVGAVASADVSEERAAKLRDTASDAMWDLSGPFWRISAILNIDGRDGLVSMLEHADGKKASLGKLNTYTKGRVEALSFDVSRSKLKCQYTLRNGVEVPVNVGDAIISWDAHREATGYARDLKEEHSQEWGAVLRHFRKENPAGIPDGRSKEPAPIVTPEVNEVAESVHIRSLMSAEEIADILARSPLSPKTLTEV